MTREMLIDSVKGQECRIAIVCDGKLEELYIERASSASHVGNIYKAVVTNVEPSIQAAFVDFGNDKNGFLHISDVHPQYFPADMRKDKETVGRKHPHKDRPPIQECLFRGQEILVQMTKEGIGTKGPTMTTYLSIPGRLLVMMPAMKRLGVSRKVEDEEARIKARQILGELKLPDDMGFILRTAGIGQNKKELQRDLNYLTRLWSSTKKMVESSKAPLIIYKESDLVIRTIRDIYNSSIKRIVCDSPKTASQVVNFLNIAMPRTIHNVEIYDGTEGLFFESGLETEIEKVYCRRVELPSGGSLVIDPTEALVAIDVNSGRSREHSNAEATALNTNIEAAHEIALQLRLRDLGGVVVMDFIDMREENNRRKLEKFLRDEMKIDRAKSKVLRMNNFGIIQMTRQRLGPPLKRSIYNTCNHCEGSGLIKSQESQALSVMRTLKRICGNDSIGTITITVPITVAHHLANTERAEISRLEGQSGKTIFINHDSAMFGSEINISCLNPRGSNVAWDHPIVQQSKKKEFPTKTFDSKKFKIKFKKEKHEMDIFETQMEIEEIMEAPEDLMGEKGTEPKEIRQEENKTGSKRSRRGRRGGKKHKSKVEVEDNKSQTPVAADKPEIKPEIQPKSETKPRIEAEPKAKKVTTAPKIIEEATKKITVKKTVKKVAKRTVRKTLPIAPPQPRSKVQAPSEKEIKEAKPKTKKKKSAAEVKHQEELKKLSQKAQKAAPITFEKETKKTEKKEPKNLFEALGIK